MGTVLIEFFFFHFFFQQHMHQRAMVTTVKMYRQMISLTLQEREMDSLMKMTMNMMTGIIIILHRLIANQIKKMFFFSKFRFSFSIAAITIRKKATKAIIKIIKETVKIKVIKLAAQQITMVIVPMITVINHWKKLKVAKRSLWK